MKYKLYVFSVVCLILSACGEKKSSTESNNASSIFELIVGGDDRILILNYDSLIDGTKKINWELTTSEIIGLPDSIYPMLIPVDDHKSVANDKKLLISSSSGAVVLLDRETKKSEFFAIAPNAHSIDYLPNNRIAVALSTAEDGNRIEIYDSRKSAVPIFNDTLYSGHGVTWNEDRKLLFALGYDELRAYKLVNWDSDVPKLELEKKWKLPESGGHDLFAPTSNYLLASSSNRVWKFEIDTENFMPFDPIANEKNVKSIFFNNTTGELLYTKGENDWWTHHIYSKNPENKFSIPEMRVYKTRVIKKPTAN